MPPTPAALPVRVWSRSGSGPAPGLDRDRERDPELPVPIQWEKARMARFGLNSNQNRATRKLFSSARTPDEVSAVAGLPVGPADPSEPASPSAVRARRAFGPVVTALAPSSLLWVRRHCSGPVDTALGSWLK